MGKNINQLKQFVYVLIVGCVLSSCKQDPKSCIFSAGNYISTEKEFGFRPKLPLFHTPKRYEGLLFNLKKDSEIFSEGTRIT